MMRNVNGLAGWRQIKAWINWLLDRIIGICDIFLMDACAVPLPSVRKSVHHLVRVTGDFCWLLRDFPRISAYRISGPEWSIVFVGGLTGLREVRKVLFTGSEVDCEELGRFEIWSLRQQAQQWMDGGITLVICELSRLLKGWTAPTAFSVPLWIQQVVEIPEQFETIISGGQRTDIRKEINKSRKAGFGSFFTTSKQDFGSFYRDFYVPYVKSRHGDSAMITPYQDQWKRWFRRGGMMMATYNGIPVAGLISYMAYGTCFLIESGISPMHHELRQRGIKAFLHFSTMSFAHARGCRKCDMGGSLAYRANGAFSFKRDVRRRRIYPVWRFLARNIPESLRNRLNELGFITEIDGKFWGIYVSEDNDGLKQQDIEIKLKEMSKAGLSGLAVVFPGKHELFPCVEIHKSEDSEGAAADVR
jgi:hypothetical protein